MIKKIERLQELIDDSIARDRLTDEDLQNIKELRKLKRLLGER